MENPDKCVNIDYESDFIRLKYIFEENMDSFGYLLYYMPL
ncbi:hypothetical protein MHK_006840 [Candidatus Magnetomorum sp. HK-1]|nr:hypothetical protein MHK_006840 [Candidatus Magnetomorum sp. HK-1]